MPLNMPSKINHGKSRGSPALRSKSRDSKGKNLPNSKRVRSHYKKREKEYEKEIRRLNETRPDTRGDITPHGYRQGQIGNYTPNQQELFKRQFEKVGPESYVSRLAAGDEKIFEEMEKPAWRQFQQAQGELGSRFAELAPGAMSARKGTGFQNAAEQLSSDYALGLYSKRQELMREARHELREHTNELLGQRPFDKYVIAKPKKYQEPEEEGGNYGIPGMLVGGATGYLTKGPAGVIPGAKAGFDIGNQF
jgi:hypothetical protein